MRSGNVGGSRGFVAIGLVSVRAPGLVVRPRAGDDDLIVTGPPGPTPAATRQRGDIQGLRAVAVLMVLLYHAGVPFVRGGFAGVDVFFVISGFLITGLVVREIERTGSLSLVGFWARRAKRLLPATALVLVTVAVLSAVLLPQVRWLVTAGDIGAAALYVVNWRLAGQAVDYLAQNYPPSPVQHFWSLAVEEQFYLFWPLLVLLIAAAARQYRLPLRRALAAGLALVAALSLGWALARSSEPSAYFVTTTRAWELAIGAGLAVALPRLGRLPAPVARGMTWAGLLILVDVAVFLPDSVPWPGPATLLPTLATAAVIAGGSVRGPSGAGFLLSRAPMRRIGDLSYSLYLWHWPLLVLARARWGDFGWLTGLLVVLVSCVPAVLAHRFVEQPLHHAPSLSRLPVRGLALGLVCTLIGVAAGYGLRLGIPSVAVVAAAERPGAAALLTTPGTAIAGDTARSITPDPLHARDDLPDLYARGCQNDYATAAPKPCAFGTLSSPVTVALVGDSRAAQWAPAVQAIAAERGWRVVTVTKAGCPFADVPLAKGPVGDQVAYPSCVAWNRSVASLLVSGPYRATFVVTSAFSPYIAADPADPAGRGLTGAANQAALAAGFHRSWAALNRVGIPVVALRETPLMSTDVAECVAQHRTSLTTCDRLRSAAMRNAVIMKPAAAGLPATRMLDLTDAVCPTRHCPVVIGNVLIYRDNHHLTATYARSLAPFLSTALAGLRRDHFASDRLRAVLPTR